MGHTYRAVGWNRQKRRYDLALVLGIAAYLGAFVGLGASLTPTATAETLLIRGLGSAALTLLHVILCIGPLARLDTRFLPLLYNRRHLGVAMFLLAFGHGAFALIQFHALGDVNPLVSLLSNHADWGNVAQFPFELLGVGALAILFLMAATSHDFWLANLSAPVWKTLHMGVYTAYTLLIGHVFLGTFQIEGSPWVRALLGLGVLAVAGLHTSAWWVGRRREAELEARAGSPADDGFVRVALARELPTDRPFAVTLGGERVAVCRTDAGVTAVSGVCQHQNGPLTEGRLRNGCLVCPWHGYEYKPGDGCSPEPFTERIPTFRVRVQSGQVWVHPQPSPAGTPQSPAPLDGEGEA
ncbi:MAG: Rieske 2Fe-2S domain-containing protein [Planctomycetota bacterium]|jgi:nitrite reductase/ring-hydroxylating ferredoxin subunit/DMSO/TMAO reductase YedYZ heme-binding membrane subunit